MKFKIVITIIFFYRTIETVKLAEDSLRLVHVFFRHGDRTPDKHEMYPNDIYTEDDFEPMGFGQLTNRGKLRSYQLGKLLRERYDKFLGNIYKSDILEMTSTDYDRTKTSALLVLAGLYPPEPSQLWNNQLRWLPMPYNFEKANHDYFLRRPTHYCPKYLNELKKVEESEDYKKIMEYYSNTLQYIKNFSGKNITVLHDAFQIYQTLHAEENMNFTLPEWSENIYPDILNAIAGKQCEFENYNDVLKRLNGGRALKKVVENMKLKIDNSWKLNGRKLFMYSGHENNVINILAAVGITKLHVVEFSSATIIELHYLKDLKNYAIKVLFVKSVYEEPIVEVVPGCKKLCLFDNFLNIIDSRIPDDYTKECESSVFLGE